MSLSPEDRTDAAPAAPVPGGDEYWQFELRPGQEPVVTGTLFAVIVILIIIAAIWIIMYLRLLDR